jgi:hypothetical protein
LHGIDQILHEASGFDIGSCRCLFGEPALAQEDSRHQVSEQMGRVGPNGLLVSFGMKEIHVLFQTSFRGNVPLLQCWFVTMMCD